MKTNRDFKKYGNLNVALLFTFVYLLLIPSQAEAQLIMGARATSMGQAITAMPGDVWQVFGNPSLLPDEGRSVSFYGIRYYGFSELTDMALAGHYAHRFGNFAVGMHTYGDDLFRESRFRIAYSRGFEGIYFGVIVNYAHMSIERFGSAGALVFDAGISYVITDGLIAGSRATNLTRSTIGRAGEELPRELALGLSYTFSDRGTVSSEIVKDARFPLAYRGGMEVRVIDNFYLRGGFTTEPLTYSAGMGYNHNRWGINIGAQQHYVLGWNPGFDFNIRF